MWVLWKKRVTRGAFYTLDMRLCDQRRHKSELTSAISPAVKRRLTLLHIEYEARFVRRKCVGRKSMDRERVCYLHHERRTSRHNRVPQRCS